MSILAALNRAYERLLEQEAVPPFGYSTQQISFLISLNDDGTPAGPPVDLREGEGKKKAARPISVPQPAKRTSGIAPTFLWDKTSYVLGVTAGAGKRLPQEHEAFKASHEQALADTNDPGLQALLKFLRQWQPADFDRHGWPEEMKDQNIIFAIEQERLSGGYIHDRPAAQALLAQLLADKKGSEAVCLISGEKAPVARLHPPVKGVWGAQSSGASLVSFNLDAFASYGHEQGENAPVSERAASAYTAALNKFLERGSRNRLQIGDASTVFWAEGPETQLAENIFSTLHGEQPATGKSVDEQSEAKKVGAILDAIRDGRPLVDVAPELNVGVRFYVLGLAPNAARLSIRFWLEDDFGHFVRNFQRFLSDLEILPLSERDAGAPLWRYLLETATLGKRENVPPRLAGDWMRAILAGTHYPLTLMSTILMRLRADKQVNALRVAMLKAVLVRNFGMTKEAPVAFDPENRNKGYLLGRLFAVYEQIQYAALGRKLNTTVKDKFYGSASTQPRKVFPILSSGSTPHLAKVGKQAPGYKSILERGISEIMNLMSPGDDPFPSHLSSEEQALFALGYYHQRNEFFKSGSPKTPETEEIAQ